MIQLTGFELPSKAIRRQISQALDVILQTARLTDESRRVISVSEVVGMEGDTISVQELFVFERDGVEGQRILGRIVSTGLRPHFVENMKASSHDIDTTVFEYLRAPR